MFDKIISNLEKLFTKVLVVAALVYISFEVIELTIVLVNVIVNYDYHEAINNMEYEAFERFIHIFFNILIALEMIETIRIEKYSHRDRAKIILLICLIAISRKILDFDFKHTTYENILAIGALVVTLTLGYYLLGKRKSNKEELE